MKVLVNAVSCKQRSGGGFQIALNFLYASLKREDVEWCYIVSSDLDKVIGKDFENLKYFVMPTQPDFLGSYKQVRKDILNIEIAVRPDVVYSVIAPSYFSFKTPEVMRFANAWITDPNPYAKRTLNLKDKIRNFFYYWNLRRLMKKRKFFITQTEVVKQGIQKITGAGDRMIRVIPNVLPAYFSNLELRQLNTRPWDGIINIACVGAPYLHKNISIIPEVVKILKEEYSLSNIKFLVTIPNQHPFKDFFYNRLNQFNAIDNVENFGYVNQKGLADLYSQCDLCFVPSVLETFSATILEAMFFNLPIVASNLDFNKEVTKDSALYFDPMDAYSAAQKIALLIKNRSLREDLKNKMPNCLNNYISYDKHIDQTIQFLYDCMILSKK